MGVFVTEVYKTLKNKETLEAANEEESGILMAAEEPSRTIPIYSDYREGCVPLFANLRAACGTNGTRPAAGKVR